MSFDWQHSARVCAWLDLVQVIILGLLVLCAVCLLCSSHGGSSKSLMLVSIVLVACVAFNFWAAIILFQATSSGIDPASALSKCSTWRIVTIIVLILTALADLSSKKYVQAVTLLIIRGVFLYIVSKYITELEGYNRCVERHAPELC